MKNSFFLFCFSIILFSFACKTKKEITSDKNTVSTTSENTQKLIVDSEMGEPASADFTIENIKIEGNILFIDVSYSGGCAEHKFNLYFNGTYLKSLPPKISLFLQHEPSGDACRELINETIKFDISASQYEGQKEIKVMVGGSTKEISYTY